MKIIISSVLMVAEQKQRGVLYRCNEVIANIQFWHYPILVLLVVGESCERLLNVISDLCVRANIESNEN
jgi:hypothetical protein